MRRTVWAALCVGFGALAAAAACSSFSAADAPEGDSGGASDDGPVADVAAPSLPPLPCPLVPTAAPCTAGCEEKLPSIPDPATGTVVDARLAVRRDVVYVARTIDKARAELFTYDSSGVWTLRGSYAAAGVYGIGVNDTTILLSLAKKLADGGAANQQIVELDVECDAGCDPRRTTTLMSTRAGPGVVTVGQHFYFSADDTLMTLKDGPPVNVASEFGAPSVAADCTSVYYSNAFDHAVHRQDDPSGLSVIVGKEVGIFDASVYDGAYPGTVTLAVNDTSVFASTLSNGVYTMPKDPVHVATPLIAGAAGGYVLADNRFVYYAKPVAAFSWNIVRVQTDGRQPLTLSNAPIQVTDATMDADHVYVIDVIGRVTRFKK